MLSSVEDKKVPANTAIYQEGAQSLDLSLSFKEISAPLFRKLLWKSKLKLVRKLLVKVILLFQNILIPEKPSP